MMKKKQTVMMFAAIVFTAAVMGCATRGDIERINGEINKLVKGQKDTSKELADIKEQLCKIGQPQPISPPAPQPNPQPAPQPSPQPVTGTCRPLISGDMPVMAKSGQSNYLQRHAVVEYINRIRPFSRSTIDEIIGQYIDEAKLLGINHDIAIAQMCHATEFLGNDLGKVMNYANFNRVGAVWQGRSWNGTFPNSRTGVRAHIQHLRGYASTVPFNGDVDPRFHKLEGLRGKGDTLHRLCGLWVGHTPERARAYENNLIRILEDLYDFQERYNQRGLAAAR
jgi:hypothetical protein